LLFLLKPSFIRKEKHFFILWMVSSMTVSVYIRSLIGNIEMADIDQYVFLMQEESEIPYFLREFIFWFSIRFLYNVTSSGMVTFMIIDFILFIILYRGFFLIKYAFFPTIDSVNVRYLLLGSLLFFPYFLGMNGTYRQIIAASILLSVIGYMGNKKILKAFLSYVFSIFIHNPVLLFLPLLFIFSKKRYKVIAVIGLLFSPVIFWIVFTSENAIFIRSEGNKIGENITYIYLLSFLFLLSLSFLIGGLKKTNNRVIFYFWFIVITLYSILAGFLESGSAERYALYIYVLIFPILGLFFEGNIMNKVLVRLTYYHLSIVPLLTYYQSSLLKIMI